MSTQKIIIRKAQIKDVKQIVNVIKPYAQKQIMLHRKESDIVQNLRDFYVAVTPKTKKIVGCAALHIYTDRLSEIKALAVAESFKGFGLGKRLIKRCLKEAKELGVPKVFALTYVPDFFVKLKFTPSNKELLPEKIWEECSKCSKYHNCTENCLVYTV